MMEAVNSATACGLLGMVGHRRLLRIGGWWLPQQSDVDAAEPRQIRL